jgi:lipopolysaccharide export system protein LptA
MRNAPSLVLALVLAAGRATGAQEPEAKPADPKPAESFLGLGGTRSKEPITITSDNLEYEYKDGVIVYRGDVLAVQGEVKIRSNELRITLVKTESPKGSDAAATGPLAGPSSSKLQAVVASGNVRIDQGTRWAVGGKATFDQKNRTLVLTENPVLHDGPNEVAGDRVVVYLDQDRSVVEGGRRRVKAVLFPDEKDAKGGKKDAAASAKVAEPAR